MNIIFLSNTGTHHALLAANIFLGHLHKPDFRFIEGFCDSSKDKSGYPIYIGEDENGNRVFTLGVGRDMLMAKKSLEDLRSILGFDENDLVVEPIYVEGQNLFMVLSHWPKILGGSLINTWGSSYLLKRRFGDIEKRVSQIKSTVTH